MITLYDFAVTVSKMREAQRRYLITRKAEDMEIYKHHERRVDLDLDEIRHNIDSLNAKLAEHNG